MLPLHRCEVRAQRPDDAARQQRDAILEPLAVADQDLASREVDVLHAQPHALHDPHPGAVEEPAEQPVHAAQPTEHRCHLFAREHHRHSRRRLRTLDVLEPRQVALEHVAVEEEDRALGEILRRCGDLALDREVRQECLDLRGPKRLGVPLAVE